MRSCIFVCLFVCVNQEPVHKGDEVEQGRWCLHWRHSRKGVFQGKGYRFLSRPVHTTLVQKRAIDLD